MKTLALGTVVLLLAGAAPPPPVVTPVEILRLEAARSADPAPLAHALAVGSPATAARAAIALGRIGRRSGAAILRRYVDDPRTGVRAAAVYALGLIGHPDDSSVIVAALGDRAGAVRVAALDALGRYAYVGLLAPATADAAVRAAVHLLRRDPSAVVRSRAALALEDFAAQPNAAEARDAEVAAFEHDPSALVRRRAMWAIFRGFAQTVAPAFLLSASRDSDEIVRIEAAAAIGRSGRRALLPVAMRLMRHDPSWRVQEQAMQSVRLLEGTSPLAAWTSLPRWLHLPPRGADRWASLPALPRPHLREAPRAPRPGDVPPAPPIAYDSVVGWDEPAPGPHPRVRIVTTEGNVYVVLFPEWAPLTVANFLNLAERGYYDDNPWFRIVPDFVVQTGDPHGNGNGDAGYTIPSEEDPLVQDAGVISMGLNYTAPPHAHAIRDSAGTQYYITLSPQYHLDRDFTVFGRVAGGWSVLARLTQHDRVLRVERIADAVLP